VLEAAAKRQEDGDEGCLKRRDFVGFCSVLFGLRVRCLRSIVPIVCKNNNTKSPLLIKRNYSLYFII
jgi:hypothetical protein